MLGEAWRSWLAQAVTGAALLLLGAWHMLRVHLSGEVGGLPSYAQAVGVFKDPVTAVLAVLFTVLVAFHAANGVEMVLVESGVGEEKAGRLARILWAAVSLYVAALAAYAYLFL